MGIKIIVGLVALLLIGIVWLRVQWGRSKNKIAYRQIIADLRSGKYVIESYADALNIMIFSKPISEEIHVKKIKQYLHSLHGQKVLDKYSVEYGDMNENSKG